MISKGKRRISSTLDSPSSMLTTTARRNQKESLMFSAPRMRLTPWPPLIPACGSHSTLGSHCHWLPALSHLQPSLDGSWQSLLLCGLGEPGTISQAFFPPPRSRDVLIITPKAPKRGLVPAGSSVRVHLTQQLHGGQREWSLGQVKPECLPQQLTLDGVWWPGF